MGSITAGLEVFNQLIGLVLAIAPALLTGSL
jgi:hypothetical protein